MFAVANVICSITNMYIVIIGVQQHVTLSHTILNAFAAIFCAFAAGFCCGD